MGAHALGTCLFPFIPFPAYFLEQHKDPSCLICVLLCCRLVWELY